jgi:hypothetical protein
MWRPVHVTQIPHAFHTSELDSDVQAASKPRPKSYGKKALKKDMEKRFNVIVAEIAH